MVTSPSRATSAPRLWTGLFTEVDTTLYNEGGAAARAQLTNCQRAVDLNESRFFFDPVGRTGKGGLASIIVAEDSTPEPSSIPFLVGRTFHERYEVVRCISTGGMGAVYEAIHLETRRRCALKVMLPTLVRDAEMRTRFKLECTVASDVESEHIVQVLDAGVDTPSGLPFLVLELLKGEELFDMLERRGSLPAEEVVLYLYQAALALERTHAAGIVHRDLKPENLFVTYRDDGSARLKILDFGIAKVVARQDKITTGFMGTPLYMAPEQLAEDGEISGRSDTYALAQLAFTMLVGTPYWDLESREGSGLYKLAARIARGLPEPASARARRFGQSLPASFDAWFAKATARDPKDRFRRALNLVAALAEALGVAAPSGLVSDEDRGRGTTLVNAQPSAGAMPLLAEPRSDSAAPTVVPARHFTRTQQLGLLALLAALGIGLGVFLSFSREGARATESARPRAEAPAAEARVAVQPSNTTIAREPTLPLASNSATAEPAAAPESTGTTSAGEPSASAPLARPPAAAGRPSKKKPASTDPLDVR